MRRVVPRTCKGDSSALCDINRQCVVLTIPWFQIRTRAASRRENGASKRRRQSWRAHHDNHVVARLMAIGHGCPVPWCVWCCPHVLPPPLTRGERDAGELCGTWRFSRGSKHRTRSHRAAAPCVRDDGPRSHRKSLIAPTVPSAVLGGSIRIADATTTAPSVCRARPSEYSV
jgi:hypothetical protein